MNLEKTCMKVSGFDCYIFPENHWIKNFPPYKTLSFTGVDSVFKTILITAKF